MTQSQTAFEVFCVAPPGLEDMLRTEARAAGWKKARAVPGGVTFWGRWPDVWRANLVLRGATRVLARFDSFRVVHLAQLDARARKVNWGAVLRADVPVRVDVTCRKSKIYHAGAAAERIGRAISEELGAPITDTGGVTLKVRIEHDNVTLSIDTSGDSLHKRGYKTSVGKAPMRETLAALFLRKAGYSGTEPVLDPMCGSGTFVIEAAEIAAGLHPGRARAFAFEQLQGFDGDHWQDMRNSGAATPPSVRFYGSDRNEGAIAAAIANSQSAGVQDWTSFSPCAVSNVTRPDGPPGLVIVNPPYGTRIGEKKQLFALHGALGQTLKERFTGWRVGIVTTDAGLASATGLPIKPVSPPVPHGGLKVRLFATPPLP